MRVISGKYKGRHIPVRKNFPSRPTTDFAKENLFNILSNHFDFEELDVLDLFAGTGSISYEFASRGARVTSVEINYRSWQFIRETASKLGMEGLKAVKADVFRWIEKDNSHYDLIFADPPYQLKGIEEIPAQVLSKNLLKDGGWFIIEHGDPIDFSSHAGLIDRRSYGSVNFSIFSATSLP